MTTLETTPAIPVVGLSTRNVFELEEVGANQLRVWVTDAPAGSQLKNQLEADGENRIQITNTLVEMSGAFVWNFEPDVAGVYVLAVQEYSRADFTGGYEADPDGSRALTKLGSESTLYVRVAERLVLDVNYGRELRAEFVVYALNLSVVETTLAVHGEKSPVLNSISQDPRVAVAILASTVQAGIDAVVGTATTALGTLSLIFNDFRTNFNAHLSQATVHANNDGDNAIDAGFGTPTTEKGLIDSVNELLRRLERHMRNDSGTGTGSAASDYHTLADNQNRLLVTSCNDLATAVVALGDAWRAYEAHRVKESSVHANADATNDLAALTSLLNLFNLFSKELVKFSPTVPATMNSAAATLTAGAGFKKKEL